MNSSMLQEQSDKQTYQQSPRIVAVQAVIGSACTLLVGLSMGILSSVNTSHDEIIKLQIEVSNLSQNILILKADSLERDKIFNSKLDAFDLRMRTLELNSPNIVR